MAIGWGTIGIIWRRPIFTVLVRPSRYTYKLIEQTNDFTVNIVGTVSGRDHNKFKEKHITAIPSHKIRAPIIKECLLHFECRVIYPGSRSPRALPVDECASVWSGCRPLVREERCRGLCPWGSTKMISFNRNWKNQSSPHCIPKDDFHRVYFGEIVACQHEG